MHVSTCSSCKGAFQAGRFKQCWLGIDPFGFLFGKASNVKWPKWRPCQIYKTNSNNVQLFNCKLRVLNQDEQPQNLRGSALALYAFCTKIFRMDLEAVQLQIQRLGRSQLHIAQQLSKTLGRDATYFARLIFVRLTAFGIPPALLPLAYRAGWCKRWLV